MFNLEQLKRKPVPKTKKEFKIQIGKQEKVDKIIDETFRVIEKEDFREEENETIIESDEKEQMENNIEIEKPKKDAVKFYDKRAESDLDRELILRRIQERKRANMVNIVEPNLNNIVVTEPIAEPDVAIIEMDEAPKEKPNDKPILTNKVVMIKKKIKIKQKEPEKMGQNETEKMGQNETEKMGQNETEKMGQNETEKMEDEPPKVKAPIKRKLKLPEKGQIFLTNKIIQERIPRPVKNSDKILQKTSTYYLNNRKIAIQKLNDLFKPYREEVINDSENISCESLRTARDSNTDFQLLTHQKLIRDYLNLITPYRGLLLYFSLGSGKSCSAIAIAEGMKTDKQVYILTPASLKQNFFSELKKCGDKLFRKNQYWEFVSTTGKPEYVDLLSNALSLSREIIEQNNGAWLVDINKPSNYKDLDTIKQKAIDEQINQMIRSKYIDINYNSHNTIGEKIRQYSDDFTKNPFDHSVVIIDEVHNFVSLIVNKIKASKKESNSIKLYNYLMAAVDIRIVFLTGTPIINYPNEIAILYNMLRGFIRTWTFPLNINTSKKINRDTILEMFDKENFNTYDYVEYSGNELVITRNPFGFINSKKRENKREEKQPAVARGGTRKNMKKINRKTKKQQIKENQPVITIETTQKLIEKNKEDLSPSSLEYQKLLYRMENNQEVSGRDFDDLPYVYGGEGEFDKYNGLKYDETGNITDDDFQKMVIRILKRNDIDVQEKAIKFDLYKALPDSSNEFLDKFVNPNDVSFINKGLFQRRVLGLTSYYRSTQEKLLPRFQTTEDGNNYHIVGCEMSDYQFSEYEKIRKSEADREKKTEKMKRMKKAQELFSVSSSYRIMSRSCCNYAFPNPPGRPYPNSGKKDKDEEQVDEEEEDVDVEETNENMDEDSTPIGENDQDYLKRIKVAMDFLKDNATSYLLPEGLRTYSPKFLNILENIRSKDNAGLHLVYSTFRRMEGIGILILVLEANGFAQLKISKTSGEWKLNISEEDRNKPKFVLYTGKEDEQEKEIMLKIYNSEWDLIPPSISSELKKIHENNYYGEIAKVLMITSSGAEGINLKNTRYVHIVEPFWHMVRLEQVIGRARRICSHEFLPLEMQTVKVFLYLAKLSEKQSKDEAHKELLIRDVSRRDNKTPVTTDESLFEIAKMKDLINQQLLTAIKESSIDCSVYAPKSNENLVCYNYGIVRSNQFGSFPSLEEDQQQKTQMDVKEKKVKLIKIKQKGVEYAYNKTTGAVYDYSSYLRSLETGENLVYIGKIVTDANGKQVIDKTIKE
jgi:Helicase conserved C-terminal domain